MKVTSLCGIALVLTCKVFADQLGEPRCKKPDEVYGNAQLKSDLGALEKFTDGFEVSYRCKPGFVTSSSLKRTCSNGTWTSIECTQRCRLEQCYRKCMYIGDYPPRGLVEHGVRVTKVCREEFEFEPEDLRHHANYTSTCDEGQISFPECIQRRCKIPIGEKGGDIKTYSPGDLVHCGLTVKKSCDSTQELYNSDRMSYLDSETFENTCKLGQWSKPDFPVCRNRRCTIKRFNGTKLMSELVQLIAGQKVRHGTTLDIECVTGYENHGPSQARCDRGKLLENAPCRPKSCHLPAIENSEHNRRSQTLDHGQTSNASCEATHILVKLEDRSSVGFVETKCLFGNLTVTLDGFICEPNYYVYNYEYDNHEEENIEDHGTCSPPENGMAKRLFLDIYEVVCHQGYTLNNFGNNHQYICDNGKLLNDFNKEANCMENKCVLSTELLSNMDVFGNRSRNEVFLSADSKFDPGRSLLFNCKTKNHEPVHRMFQCRKGQWIAADKDPSWFMDIENGNYSCRPAECNRCVFGDCIKDGICNCHQGATGKYCATLGCTLPQERDHLSFKKDGLPATFEVGATLPKDRITCLGDFIPSTNKDIHCNEGGKWSEDVSCIPAAIYEIEVTVAMGKWDGTWNTLNVSFINEKGQTTPRFPIQTTLFLGQTYNAKIRTLYIGEIQRLHFTLHGKQQDTLGLQYINLKVTRGGQVEEYAIHGERNIVDQDNFNVDPGCPPPSTNGRLLRPKKRYKMGDKIQPNDVQCEPGYILSSTVTCTHNVKWSATCEKEADTMYTLTFSGTRGTRQKITVVLHGTGGSTKELALNQQGVLAASTFSKSWTLPSVGEINSIDVNVEEDFRSFAINYVQLIDQKRNLYYLSFHDGNSRGKNTLQIYDQFRPGCKGTTFLPEQNGYLKNPKLAKYSRIPLWQDCEDLCRKDGSCTAFMVYKRFTKHCYLVGGYSLGQFKFAPNNNEYKIYFRACS